ncbi:MAG: VWA domain-containing protein [Thermoanaerobaculia bacterium]
MKPDIPQRTGTFVVAALAAVTAIGYLATQKSAAVPAASQTPATATSFAAPGGAPVAFSGRLDRGAVVVGGDGRVMMELVLAAEERRAAGRTPTDMVVVLDRSGSMGDGVKMAHARSAVRELVSRLQPDDRFALVAYSDLADLAIPLAPASFEARGQWLRIVESIGPGGGTAMSSGLDAALDVLAGSRSVGRATRVLLISDGLANQGDASFEGLTGRAALASRREAAVSTIGVGEDFNEYLMSAIADAGTGNYYYLEDVEGPAARRLAQVFTAELETGSETVASAVVISIETADGVRVVEAAGYPLERRGTTTTFRPGSLFSGQERRVWVTLEVPRDTPGKVRLGTFRASYVDGGETRIVAFDGVPAVECVDDETRYYAAIDGDAWAQSASEEDFNRVQMEVARHVRQGRRDQALAEISAYRVENEQMNQHLKRDDIAEMLEELKRFEAEVEDAFEGAGQQHKQNLLSKQRQADGLDGRRPGSKKASGNQ